MGRRPNPLIGQYFDRGTKLPDQSNRYPHTCRQCGEHFPRGRLDTLTGHLTKKCPGISESERVNILLSLSGMSKHAQQGQLPHHAPQHGQQLQSQPNGPSTDVSMAQRDMQRDWTALGMLAEVSRVFTQVERNDDQVQSQPPGQAGTLSAASQGAERFEMQPQFPEDGQEVQPVEDAKAEAVSPQEAEMTPEDRIQDLLRADNANSEPTNLTMAAAATARLQPGLLDPQLLGAEAAAAAAAATAAVNAAVSTPADVPEASSGAQSPVEQQVTISAPTISQPWGEITYPTEGYHPPLDPSVNMATPAARGGFRLDANGAKSRHSRQRFTPHRREEVKDVRKIGACIRCKILRKTCSKGEPCETCRKVLSPRIWRSGCCRAKFTEQLDMYQAAVQNVMAQNHINKLKQLSTNLVDRGLVLQAHNFPEHPSQLQLHILQSEKIPEDEAQSTSAGFDNSTPSYSVMMLDEKQDIPAKVEKYMREILPELINQEPSHFVQATLRQGLELANASNDELLKKAIELWGHVELVNRERQWVMSVVSTVGDDDSPPAQYITEDSHQETFTTICLQLTAGAERKASQTSKALLTGMQRVLQDSKVKMDFNMYLTSMILLNCIEKSTWEFKAWEQPNLRMVWPLPKEPSTFLRQGRVMSDLLRMLLVIRKVQPRTARRDSDGKLVVTDEENPTVRHYFETINLDFAEVKAKQDKPTFSPTDPRSFEFMFCSTLLLPSIDEKPPL